MFTASPVYVIGAGGIGCAVGYALRTAGVPVVFVEADAGKVAWGQRNGIQVDGYPPLPAVFLPFADWQPPPASVVLLCTKCYDNPAVLARLPASVQLLPIQNGFDPVLEQHGHALEGIASFVSECYPGQTRSRITRQGYLHIGPRGAGAGNGLFVLAKLWKQSGLFRVAVVPDILPYKYTKLMYNAAISPLAAAAGLDNGQLLTVPQARQLFFQLLQENYTILKGAGIALARIGPFHPNTVHKILRRHFVATSLAWAFYPTLRGSYCSMAGDLPKGRTEIDNYNGHLLTLAGDRPCGLNRRVYALVKRMEQENISPHRQILDTLASDEFWASGVAAAPAVAQTRRR